MVCRSLKMIVLTIADAGMLNRYRDNFPAASRLELRENRCPGNEHRACLFNGKFGDAIKLEEGGETY